MLIDFVYPHELRFNFVGPHDNIRCLGFGMVRVRGWLGLGDG